MNVRKKLLFKRLHSDAVLPTIGSYGAIGLDLYACPRDKDGVLFSHEIKIGCRYPVPTGISVEIPRGYYGRIAPRSGLAKNEGLIVNGGVVDDDYRGELFVLLMKPDGLLSFWVRPGMKIAQLILERADKFEPEWSDALTETARGSNGFGSTGL